MTSLRPDPVTALAARSSTDRVPPSPPTPPVVATACGDPDDELLRGLVARLVEAWERYGSAGTVPDRVRAERTVFAITDALRLVVKPEGALLRPEWAAYAFSPEIEP